MTFASQVKVKWFSKVQAIPAALLLWVLFIVCLGAQSELALGQTSGEPAAIALFAQQQAQAKQLRALLLEDWRSFSTTELTRDLSAIERICQMDAWQLRQQTRLDELRKLEIQLVRPQAIRAQILPNPVPIVADIQATNSEIAAAVERLHQLKVPLVEHIANMDEFFELNREALEQRDHNLLELNRLMEIWTAEIPAPVQETPKTARIRELANQLKEKRQDISALSPVERIAVLEEGNELERLVRELDAQLQSK